MGIDINRTIAATFFIGAVLAGAGGTIFGLYYNTLVFDLGFSAGLFAFTAAVFGGIGNIPGAALGGLLIGLITALWDGYMESTWTQVIIFAILILVLVFSVIFVEILLLIVYLILLQIFNIALLVEVLEILVYLLIQ